MHWVYIKHTNVQLYTVLLDPGLTVSHFAIPRRHSWINAEECFQAIQSQEST